MLLNIVGFPGISFSPSPPASTEESYPPTLTPDELKEIEVLTGLTDEFLLSSGTTDNLVLAPPKLAGHV